MFDSSFTSKEQGNVALGVAISYFTSKKYTVLLPLNDSQEYDLVIDSGSELSKVQVKSTRCTAPSGNYVVELRNKGGTAGVQYGSVATSLVDLLFILTSSGIRYLIPRQDFINIKSSITLGDKYKEFIV